MNPERGLFEAILENPDDLTLRLIYADWCDEQGDPRGEFIRIQCELAAHEGPFIKVRHLKQREAELLKEHRRQWNGEIHRRLAGTPLCNQVHSRRGLIRRWEYRRGFVEFAVVEARAFLEFPEALFQIGPLRRLTILGADSRMVEFTGSPYLNRLQAIEVNSTNSTYEAIQREISRIPRSVAASTLILPTHCQPTPPGLLRDLKQTFLGDSWQEISMSILLAVGFVLIGFFLCAGLSLLLGKVLEFVVLKLNLGPLFY